jgi:hypothetical protein
VDPRPRWGEVGIHGIHRLREWDTVVAVDAPAVPGDEHELVVLPGEPLPPHLAALAPPLEPPYRAHAVRRSRTTWAVAARRIEVVRLSPELPGAELVLSWDGHQRLLEIDGLPDFRPLPELEELAATRFDAYAIHGTRLDESVWEIRIDPL